jgi:hypothetical protein
MLSHAAHVLAARIGRPLGANRGKPEGGLEDGKYIDFA